MYEKLERIREDLKRAKKRQSEAAARVKAIEAKLKAAESTQILADVGAMNLSPEQVAQVLQLVSSGRLAERFDNAEMFGRTGMEVTETADMKTDDYADKQKSEEKSDEEY